MRKAPAGRIYDYPDMCGYCEMTTGRQHQCKCPLFQPIGKFGIIFPEYLPDFGHKEGINEEKHSTT